MTLHQLGRLLPIDDRSNFLVTNHENDQRKKYSTTPLKSPDKRITKTGFSLVASKINNDHTASAAVMKE